MNYPGQLEHFWREEARRLWGFLPEDALVERIRPHVQKLSDRFTTERGRGIEPYGDDDESRLAYGLFFFPQTFVRTQLVLEECVGAGRLGLGVGEKQITILDLGAGTGAAGLAALQLFHDRPARLVALDHSAGSLAALKNAFEAGRKELWPHAELETRTGNLMNADSVEAGWDLILASFAINEPLEGCASEEAEQWLKRTLALLNPGGLLVVIEPALKTTAERLESLRDRVAAEGWAHIVGPCLHRGPCPMRAEGRFWCHEVRRWSPPPLAEKINRTLFRDLPHLKFSFLALRAKSIGDGVTSPRTAAVARLVAPMTEQRGKFVTRGCAADSALHDYEILTRHLSAEQRQAIAATERGTRVEWRDLNVLGNGALRASALSAPPHD